MELFSKLDKNKDGYITLKELKEGMKDYADIEEVVEILEGIDIDHNGAINYTEFIAATLDQNKIFAEKFKLREVFNALDKDRSGFIDVHDLQEVLEKDGAKVLREVIEEIDKDGDKQVNFEEFKNMMEDIE